MTSGDRTQIEELKALANKRQGEVLSRLGVDARPKGRHGTIAISDPMSRDTEPSLVIWCDRPGGLSWKRYGSDAQGDIINLVAYLKGWWWGPGRGSGEAIAWLKDLLGLRRMSDAERREALRRQRHADARRREDNAAELEQQRRWARATFFDALEDIRGTAAETYLRERRGIDLEALPKGPRGGDRTPKFLRFIPRHKHVAEGGAASEWPCIVACCVSPASGKVLAIHRTWLTADGRDKAPVKPPRKCFPDFGGLIIPCWKGETGLSVGEANAIGLRETLGLTEGWEDGLSWAIACPQRRVWAAISLSNMGNVVLPDCIDSLVIHRQNDWVKLAAVRDFERQKSMLEAQGRPVAEIMAHHGKDLSDTLRGAA